jgi:hypothetical protein
MDAITAQMVHQNKDSLVDKLVVDPNIWNSIAEKFL